MVPVKRVSRCRQCGRHKDQVGRISARGLCPDCGAANFTANAQQLAAGRGPAFNLWAKRTAEGLGAYQAKLHAAIDQEARRLG